jgi:RimJ/RimL family protein N-acetyltransferase
MMLDDSVRAGMELDIERDADLDWLFRCSLVFKFWAGENAGGCIVARIVDDDTLDMHIAALPQARGRPAYRAAKTVIQYVTNTLGYRRLIARVNRDHVGSQIFAGSLGFRRVGLDAEHITYELIRTKEVADGRSVQ